MVDDLLAGNRRFQEGAFCREADRHQSLLQGQSPSVLWIGCSDSRVPVNLITDTRAGDLFVHRNVGNIISTTDWNLGAVIEYSMRQLKIPDIVVCGHYRCGALQALETGSADGAYLPVWLKGAHQALHRAEEKLRGRTDVDPIERSRLIVEENVRLQLDHLQEFDAVRRALEERRLTLHGWVYVLATGEIKPLECRGTGSA